MDEMAKPLGILSARSFDPHPSRTIGVRIIESDYDHARDQMSSVR
jgi:hypothetical protein